MPRKHPKVVVFSKGKEDMTYTGEWFKRNNFTDAIFVVSDGDSISAYRKSTGCDAVVSDSFNLASKRQWALDNLTSAAQPWLLFFEDNIKRVTALNEDMFHVPRLETTQRKWFHTREPSPQEVIAIMRADTVHAERIDAYYGGYASNDNHSWRKVKNKTVGFVWTKMAYCRSGGPKWPVYLNEMDDYGFTAEALAYSGRVYIHNYLFSWAKRGEGRGGSRTLEQRVEDKRKSVLELHRRFPGLFRDNSKKKSCIAEGTEIVLKLRSEEQIDEWRKSLCKPT